MLYWLLKYVLLGPVAATDLPAGGRGARARTRRRVAAILASNHLSFSDSIFMPLMVQAEGDLRRQAGVLHRQGHQGLPDQDVLRGRRHDPGGPIRWSGGPGGDRHRPARAARGQAVRHLPGGDPVPGRSAAPRQDRRSPAGAGERCTGDPRGHAQRRRDPTASGRSFRGSGGSGSGSARRWTSPGTPGWPATGSSSAPSPTRSCTS